MKTWKKIKNVIALKTANVGAKGVNLALVRIANAWKEKNALAIKNAIVNKFKNHFKYIIYYFNLIDINI